MKNVPNPATHSLDLGLGNHASVFKSTGVALYSIDMKPSSAINVFVDVDDTLIRTMGTKRIPMPAVIQHIRDLHAQGAILFCWSAGGAEYARKTAEELGIAQCFSAFIPKPNVFIDDQSANNWPRSILVHPSSCPGNSLNDYREQLK